MLFLVVLPIQFVGPIRHAVGDMARPIAEDAELAAAFFANRTAFIDAYANVTPQPDFDLVSFWRQQDILDFWLTLAHHVSPCLRNVTLSHLPTCRNRNSMTLSICAACLFGFATNIAYSDIIIDQVLPRAYPEDARHYRNAVFSDEEEAFIAKKAEQAVQYTKRAKELGVVRPPPSR